jgi:hypothetical protein
MTTRIYTIPAREVVPGMLLQNIVGGGWWPVATVTLTECRKCGARKGTL